MANNLKQIDGQQVLRSVFDPDENRLRVDAQINAQIGQIEVIIDHTEDSIRLGDGTSLTTTTTVSSDVGLDVNLITPDVDIRDLSHTQDSIRLGDGVELVNVNSSNELQVRDDDLNSIVGGQTASGSLTAAGQSVVIASSGSSTVGFTITGTFTGTLVIQGTVDGTNWVSLRYYEPTTLTVQGVIVAPTTGVSDVGGFTQVRIVASVLSSGTATVEMSAQIGDNITQVVSPLASSFFTTAYLRDGSGTSVTLGQKTAASSLPVVIASDQADLDIRDLDHSQDSVRLGDGTNLLTSTTVGSDYILNVKKFEDPTFYTRVDEVDALTTYTGKTYDLDAATSASVWQITRTTISGNETITQYANDVATYNQIWDNRISLFGPVPFVNTFSIQFDGANDYIDVANNSSIDFDFRSEAASWNFWIKTTQNNVTYFEKQSGNIGWRIYQAFNKLTVELRGGGGGDRIRVRNNVNDTYNDGSWHMLTVTYDGGGAASGVTLYVDGSALTPDVQNDTLTSDTSNAANAAIGSRSGSGDNFGPGNIDEVSIWDVELSSSEVSTIYNSGNPIDLQGQGASPITTSLNYWARMGDGASDIFPNIVDVENSITGTMTNMTAGDIETEVP